MNKQDLVSKRGFLRSDEEFIYATWLRGLYHGNSWFKEIPQDIFFSNYHKVIESILANPLTNILIMCLKDEPEVILAYSVGAKDTIHWVYCKKAWRGIGLPQDLIPEGIKTVTHLTMAGKRVKPQGVIFNPFAI